MDRGYSAFYRLATAWQPTLLCPSGVAEAAGALAGSLGAAFAPGAAAALPARTANRVLRTSGVATVDERTTAAAPLQSAARRASAPEPAWVVVVKSSLRPAQPLECHDARSLRCEERAYRVDSIAASSPSCLDYFYDAQAPRVLVVDVALVSLLGAETFRQHRRRMPATDLLLSSDPSCPPDRSLVFRSQARGCIDWSMGSEQLSQALDAVLAGELWFSRRMLQALYLSFLEGGAPTPAPTESKDAHDALTSREVEVLEWMQHGMTNRQIAERLGISVNTVKKHVAHVFEKRGLHGRRQEVS